MSKNNRVPAKRQTFWDYIGRAPLGAIVVGVSLITGGWYWSGVILFFVGAFWLARDAAQMDFYARQTRRNRRCIAISYVIAISVATWIYILIPAALKVDGSSDTVQYGPGTNIDGIPWQNDYSQMVLNIENPTENTYVDFDADCSPQTSGLRDSNKWRA